MPEHSPLRRALAFLGTVVIAACARPAAPPPGSSAAPAAPLPGGVVYGGDVRIDPATGSVQAQWRIAFIRDGSLADTVRLRLNSGFRVSSVSGPAVVHDSAVADDDGQLITVALAPAPRGSPATLDIAYAGTLVAPGDSINRISPDWVELGLDSFWQPVFAGFDQAIIGPVRLRLPAGFQGAATGTIQRMADGTYLIDARVPLVDVPFSASP